MRRWGYQSTSLILRRTLQMDISLVRFSVGSTCRCAHVLPLLFILSNNHCALLSQISIIIHSFHPRNPQPSFHPSSIFSIFCLLLLLHQSALFSSILFILNSHVLASCHYISPFSYYLSPFKYYFNLNDFTSFKVTNCPFSLTSAPS